MLGLLVLRQALLNGVAIAAAATVAMTVLASLTLLPALLGFTGLRLDRPSRLNTFLRAGCSGAAGLGARCSGAHARRSVRQKRKCTRRNGGRASCRGTRWWRS